MNSKENLRSRFLQLMTEKVKSALLPLMVDNNEATSSILADPYGKLSHITLDIIMSALTPHMLQHLKQDINAWVNEELSPPCSWDRHYAWQQKMRIFNSLSLKFREPKQRPFPLESDKKQPDPTGP